MAAFFDNFRGQWNICCDYEIAGVKLIDYFIVRDVEARRDLNCADKIGCRNPHGLVCDKCQ